MARSRIAALVFIFLFGVCGVSQAQNQIWTIPIAAQTQDDLDSQADTVNIGVQPDAQDGWDGATLEPIVPTSIAGGILERVLHYSSDPGFESLGSGGQATALTFHDDLRAPLRPGDTKVWRVLVGYFGSANQARVVLSWPALDNIPSNFIVHIGNPTEFGTDTVNGGQDMRTVHSLTVPLVSGNSVNVEVHITNPGAGQPFVAITPQTASIQVGNLLPLNAATQNSTDPVWTATMQGGGPVNAIQGQGSRVIFNSTALLPGTYIVTATVQGINGVAGTASATSTITVSTAPVLGPVINTFTPASGLIGAKVTIIGVRFAPSAQDNLVTFTGLNGQRVLATIDLSSPNSTTQLTVIVPDGTVNGLIGVTTAQGSALSADPFTLIVPQFDNSFGPVSPKEGPVNSVIRLENDPRQTNITWDANTVFLFNGTPAATLTADERNLFNVFDLYNTGTNQVLFRKVPKGATSGFVTASTNGIVLKSVSEFTIINPPTIRTMTPTSWDPAHSVTTATSVNLTGTNFGESPHPVGSATPQFRYTLTYSGIPNTIDAVNNSVSVHEDTFDPQSFGKGLSKSMLVFLDSNVQTGPITIKEEMINPNTGAPELIGTMVTPVFTVIRQPVITSFTPKQGYAGQTEVTLFGKFFDTSNLLNNTVTFAGVDSNGNKAPFSSSQATVKSVSTDGTQMVVIVPSDALTGKIGVIVTGNFAQTTEDFTVLPAVTVLPSRGTLRAGGNQIPMRAIVGGIDPGQPKGVTWAISSPTGGDPGTLVPDPSDPANTLKQIYTPPASASADGTQVVITATTVATVPAQGTGTANFTILQANGFSVDPPSILFTGQDVLNRVPVTLTATATSGSGIDISQVQWRIVPGSPSNNSMGFGGFGDAFTQTATGAKVTYIPPQLSDSEPLTLTIQATVPSLPGVTKSIPVTIHQPILSFAGTNSTPAKTSATVSWSLANDPSGVPQRAISGLKYGLNPGQFDLPAGFSIPNDLAPNALNPTGRATITGLAPNTKYYYQVIATAPGYLTATTTGSFTTLGNTQVGIDPPQVSLAPGGSQIFKANVSNIPPGITPQYTWTLSDLNNPSSPHASVSPAGTQAIVNVGANAKPGDTFTLTLSIPNIPDANQGVSTILVPGNTLVAVTPLVFSLLAGSQQLLKVKTTGAPIDAVVKPIGISSLTSGVDPKYYGTVTPGPASSVPNETIWIYTSSSTLPLNLDPNATEDNALRLRISFSAVEGATLLATGATLAQIQPPVRVTISPTDPQTVKVGGQSLTFTGKTLNSQNSSQVVFAVNGIEGGNSVLGTIRTVGGFTGIYTPPVTVPNIPITVTALSLNDKSISSVSVPVNILPGASVSVTPQTPNVGLGQTQQFTATITGADNQAVTWSVNGIAPVNGVSGNPTVGFIDANGLYTAPPILPTNPTITITAVSQAEPTVPPGTATVFLVPGVAVTVKALQNSIFAAPLDPNAVSSNDASTLIATINNAKSDQNVTWTVNGIPNGDDTVGRITLPNSPATATALYTAPVKAPTAPITIVATSVEDKTASGSVTLTVQPRPVLITPTNPKIASGTQTQFLLRDAETFGLIPNATWLVVEGDAWGTIDKATGLYTAPLTIPDPPQATILAHSSDDLRQTARTNVNLVTRILVQVTPADTAISVGQTVNFQARDANNALIPNVIWSILNPGPNSGTINSQTGVYTAPSSVTAVLSDTVQATAPSGESGLGTVHVTTISTPSVVGTTPEVQFVPNNARVVNIFWQTDIASDSLVELGPQAGSYPSKIALTDLATDHMVRVPGLTPGATYHYRVHSAAAGHTDYVSADQTFTALGEFVLDADPHAPAAAVTVDTTTLSGTDLPRTFAWPVGEQHTLTPSDRFQAGTGIQEVFEGWDTNGDGQPDNVLPRGATKISISSLSNTGTASAKAVYTPLYLLKIDTDPAILRQNGKGPKGEDFYAPGPVTISAPSPVTFAEQSYGFVNWLVDGQPQSGNPITLSLTHPVTLVAVYRPLDTEGPIVEDVAASPNPTAGAKAVRLTATVSDIGLGGANIKAAEYSVDTAANPGSGLAMAPVDGTFDSVREIAAATVDASQWKVGETHRIFVRGQDVFGNWGDPRGVAVVVTPEQEAPSTVTDLRATARVGTTDSVDLTWTAPGDNGATGQAARYEIRYSKTPITADSFANATLLNNPPAPKPAGSPEALTVSGLDAETQYYFALKAFDAAGNVSPLSNIASAITFGRAPQVVLTSPFGGQPDVAVTAPIVITFDKVMNPDSVQITVSPTLSNVQATWSADNKSVTLTHDPFLGDGTQYTVTVPQAEDKNGNKLAQPYSFLFTTTKPQGGLAETPWPMFRHDALHSGRNAFAGPVGVPNGPTWAANVPSRFSSPAVGIDRTIYVGSQGNGLVALNPDGTIKWNALQSTDWVRSSPAIASDGTVYIGLPTGELHAVNPDGSDKWSRELEGAISSSPAVGADGTVYIAAFNTVYAITPGNQIKWQQRTFREILSSPAIGSDGTVYIGSEDGILYAFAPDDGHEVWHLQTFGGVRSSPLVTDDTVYVGSFDRSFYAVNRATGEVRWSVPVGGDLSASPAVGADGNLYIASNNGTLLALSPANGAEQWRVETGEEILGSPSVDKNGVIYLGTTSANGSTGNLYAYDKTGKQLWKITTTSPISSSPIIGADGTLYIGSGSQMLLIGQEQQGGGTVKGDLNHNGKVDVPDATLALQFAVGNKTATAADIAIGDVAPAGNPNGKIDVGDATRILRASVGLDNL